MRSSRWQAHGNVYLVVEEPLDAEAVRAGVGDTDGMLEVRARGEDWLEIAIWNPDGSLAEMSGNGTRIAACWLAEQTGARLITVRVGPREVVTRLLADGLVEQELGPVVVGPEEEIAGVRFVPVDLGNPHAVVEGDPVELTRVGSAPGEPSTLSEPHQRPGRAPPRRAHDRGARVGTGSG